MSGWRWFAAALSLAKDAPTPRRVLAVIEGNPSRSQRPAPPVRTKRRLTVSPVATHVGALRIASDAGPLIDLMETSTFASAANGLH